MEKQPAQTDATTRLRAQFQAWKEQETLRILCCTNASPAEIQGIWAHLGQQEQEFEKSLGTGSHQVGTNAGNQP